MEKWTAPRDDALEYGELADLVHKCSATVINSCLEYDEYRDKDHDEMKNAYWGIADRLYDSSDEMMDFVSEDQPGYMGTAVGAMSARLQAEQNQELTDSQNEDGRAKKPEYNRQEAVLVKDTQARVISYWQRTKARPALEEGVSQVRLGYEAMAVKAGQGMIIQIELLGARERMKAAQAALETNGRERDGLRRELCAMTGWDRDARPDIREVPVPDVGKMDQTDLELDKERILEQNFTQSTNERRLAFTGNRPQWDVMNQKVGAGRGQITVDVEAKYKLLKQARADYEQTVGKFELARIGAQTVERKYGLGMTSRNEYTQQQGTMVSSQSACDIVGLKYRQTLENYRWTVNGLTQIEGAQDMVKKCLLLCIDALFACQHPLEIHVDAMPDVIRYEELETLVKAYNPQIQMEQTQYDSRLARYGNAGEEIMETRRPLREETEDLEKDDDKDSTSQYRAQARTLEDAAKDMDRQIRSARDSQASTSFRRMEDAVLWTAQDLMGTYNTLKAEQEAVLAQAEWKQSRYERLLRRVQTGSASVTQADQVGKEADGTTARTRAAQNKMEWVKKELLILARHPEGPQTEIGPMPAPWPEHVREMRGSVDKWRVLGSSYSSREQRSGGVSSDKEPRVRQRGIRRSEEVAYGQLDTLYQDVLASQTLWTSALTPTESRKVIFQAASNKLALGMLSRQEYLEAEAAYTGVATAKEGTDVGFQQVMDTYDQTLKGFIT